MLTRLPITSTLKRITTQIYLARARIQFNSIKRNFNKLPGNRRRIVEYHSNKTIKKISHHQDNTNFLDGEYSEFDEKGMLICHGTYNDNLKHGIWNSKYDGVRTYNNGSIEGTCINFYPHGSVKRMCQTCNNVHHGIYESRYENGKLRMSCHYVYGKIQGDYKKYNDEGKLIEHFEYDNDKIIKTHVLIDNKNRCHIPKSDFVLWALEYEDLKKMYVQLYVPRYVLRRNITEYCMYMIAVESARVLQIEDDNGKKYNKVNNYEVGRTLYSKNYNKEIDCIKGFLYKEDLENMIIGL